MEAIKSLVVCVEFDDFLSIALPLNRRHFSRTLVVTSCNDTATQCLALDNNCELFVTDVFYDQGAMFNKGAAIEKALDILGRDGWLCLWDADIVMPNSIEFNKDQHCLYTALRKTLNDPKAFRTDMDWNSVPTTGMENEFPGYFLLFHGSVAGRKPWFETNWRHAGGYDSNFQNKFRKERLRRPPFQVLHLGPSVDRVSRFHLRIGDNWCGRTTPRIDGRQIDTEQKMAAVDTFKGARVARSNTELERL